MDRAHTPALQEVLQAASTRLEKIGIDEAPLLTGFLLSSIMEIPRLELPLYYQSVLTADQFRLFEQGIDRLAKHEPLQYILGCTDFMGLHIQVSPDVLIPRPETEQLVEWVCEFNDSSPFRMFEAGTGSGCISIALARHWPQSHITAVDVSPAALNVARHNIQLHQKEHQIRCLQSDLFAAVPAHEKYDLVVANLPYIPEADIPQLNQNVRCWEPHKALVGGADGLDIIRRLISAAPARLQPGGSLFMEIGIDQNSFVEELLKKTGFYDIEVKKDTAGIDRLVKGSMR